MAMVCWGSSERSRRENPMGELLPNPVSGTTTPVTECTLGLQLGDDSTIARATRPDTSADGSSETVIPLRSRYIFHPLTRFDGPTPRPCAVSGRPGSSCSPTHR